VASLAEMLTASTLEANQRAGQGLPEAVTKGIGLAQEAERLQLAKQQHSQEADRLQQAKLFKAIDFVQKIDEFKDPEAQAGIIKMAPSVLGSLGFEVPKEHLNFLLKSKENRARIATARQLILDGKMNAVQFNQIFSDPWNISKIAPNQEVLLKQAGFTPEVVAGMSPEESASLFQEIASTTEKAAANKAMEQKASGTQARFEASKFDDRVLSLSDDVSKKLEPIKAGISRNDTLLKQLDPIYKRAKEGKPQPGDADVVKGLAESIARGALDVKGVMTDTDLKRVMGQSGIAGRIEDFALDLAGDPNPMKVGRFIKFIEASRAEQLRKGNQELKIIRERLPKMEAFKGRSKQAEEAIGLPTEQEYFTEGLKARSKEVFSLGGKSYSRQALEALKEQQPKFTEQIDKILGGGK